MLADARRILFVDDEPQVLQGLQRMLRPYRAAWQVLVAHSGAEALELLQGTQVDVVISDMRMPRMDGVTLLREVAVRHPETIRMVLTGYSSQEAFLRSVGPTHQVLAKPCEADQLIRTLERAVKLRQTLASPALRSLAGGVDTLPALPDLYSKVVAALGRDASMHEVGSLVARDPGMATRILQLVNSAYFGLTRAVADPVQAVSYLGVDLVRGLILSAHVFAELGAAKKAGLSLERLQRHSQGVALLARQMIIDVGGDAVSRDLAYLAGLLHDTGYLVLGCHQPSLLGDLVKAARAADAPITALEQDHLGATHGAVGAYLLGLWGLPDPAVEAVAYHHDEARAVEAGFGVLAATYLAEQIMEGAAPAFEHVHEDGEPLALRALAEALDVGAHLDSWVAWGASHAGGRR